MPRPAKAAKSPPAAVRSSRRKLYFEDFPVGLAGRLGQKVVSEAEVIDFARQFDPQPMHLDPDVASKSLLGGVAASGWHTCAMLMRLICDGFLGRTAGKGSPGLREVRWLRPVRPGDVLTADYEVLESRPSGSRPDLGICRIRYQVVRQDGEAVMTWDCTHFFGRRPAGRAR